MKTKPNSRDESTALPRLSPGKTVLYSLASMGLNMVSVTVSTWILYFYAPPPDSGRHLFLPAHWVGMILLAGSLWNALIDPFIGHWSDNFRSRFGRRRPFILAGTPVLVFSLLFIWTPPFRESLWGNGMFLLVVIFIHYGAFSLIGVPYDATLAEMALDSHSRLRLSYWKNVFGILGVLFAVIMAAPLFQSFGAFAMGAVIGIAALAVLSGSLPGIRESKEPKGDPLPLAEGMRLTLRNRPFLLFFCCTLCVYISYQMLLAVIPYLTTVVFARAEKDAMILQIFMVAALILGGPVWTLAHRRFSQSKLLQICLAGMSLSQCLFFFAGQGLNLSFILQSLVFIMPLGFFIGGFFIIAFALMGRVVDEDAVRSGRRREAAYYGSFSLAMGMGISVGSLILPLLFSLFGYTRQDPMGIRLAFPVMAAFTAAGWLLFNGFRLEEEPN